MTQRAVLIAGMHRSGTSAYARVLNLLGADLGPVDRMVKPRHDNPEGLWEHADLLRINKSLLKSLGQDWDHLSWWPDDWLSEPGLDEYTQKINYVLDRDFAQSSLWAFKDPHMSLTLPLWKQALSARNTEYSIFMPVRHPLEVASSLAIRDGLPIETGLSIWLISNLKLTEAALGQKGLILGYESLLADPQGTVNRAAEFLGISRDSSGFSAALASLRPQLRHNKVSPDEAMPALVRRLWELLKSREGSMLEPGDKKVLDDIRDEFVSRRDLALTRDLSWMAEFDAADVEHETMIRRVAVSIPKALNRSELVRFFPSRSSGIIFMKNPAVMWDSPDGLQRKPPEIMDTKELIVLDQYKGVFLSLGKNAEITYRQLNLKNIDRSMRLAFDFSFCPMPLHYCEFFILHRKIWVSIEFLRGIRRWVRKMWR